MRFPLHIHCFCGLIGLDFDSLPDEFRAWTLHILIVQEAPQDFNQSLADSTTSWCWGLPPTRSATLLNPETYGRLKRCWPIAPACVSGLRIGAPQRSRGARRTDRGSAGPGEHPGGVLDETKRRLPKRPLRDLQSGARFHAIGVISQGMPSLESRVRQFIHPDKPKTSPARGLVLRAVLIGPELLGTAQSLGPIANLS